MFRCSLCTEKYFCLSFLSAEEKTFAEIRLCSQASVVLFLSLYVYNKNRYLRLPVGLSGLCSSSFVEQLFQILIAFFWCFFKERSQISSSEVLIAQCRWSIRTGVTEVVGSIPTWNCEDLFSSSFTRCHATTIISVHH